MIEVEKLIQEFAAEANWEKRYEKIIAMGRSLPSLPEEKKTAEALVKGCQSQVWLHARKESGKIFFEGDSDALIVKGLLAVIMQVYNGKSSAEILALSPSFLDQLGFKSNLSPSRANGLLAMIKQMQHFAFAYQFID